MKQICLKAYAKINIGLNIISRRKDGYHEIETIFQQIDIHDLVKIKRCRNSKIVIKCRDKRVPTNHQNTCHKAASMVKAITGISEGIEIELEKNIPVGAGLGGGSSDAASVLIGLMKLWQFQLLI